MADEEGRALFDAAVSAVLRGWPALKMAVSHQFGGPQSQVKAKWMEGATTQWMRENVDIQCDELETFLETLLDQEFDTILDDGSTPEVSRRICDLYHHSCSGNKDSLRTFLAAHPLSPSQPRENDERMEVGVSGDSNEVVIQEEEEDKGEDGEGWEVVRKSRRRSRK